MTATIEFSNKPRQNAQWLWFHPFSENGRSHVRSSLGHFQQEHAGPSLVEFHISGNRASRLMIQEQRPTSRRVAAKPATHVAMLSGIASSSGSLPISKDALTACDVSVCAGALAVSFRRKLRANLRRNEFIRRLPMSQQNRNNDRHEGVMIPGERSV